MPKGSGKGGGGGAGGGGRSVDGRAGGPGTIVPPIGQNQRLYPSDPVLTPGGVLTGPGDELARTADVLAPIMSYTGGHVPNGERFKGLNAEKLNRTLYDPEGVKRTLRLAGESEEYIADYMKRAASFRGELNTSLSKLRNYQGEVYRTISDPGGSLASKYTPGKPVTMSEFVSTSRSPTPSYMAFTQAKEGKTRFVVESKSGKLIEKMSNFPEEHEVLFRSGTTFMVKEKRFNKDRKTWDIFLKEI